MKREKKFELWGWILFLVCAGFFIASGIRSRDLFSLLGSVVFFVACVIFIIPLVRAEEREGEIEFRKARDLDLTQG